MKFGTQALNALPKMVKGSELNKLKLVLFFIRKIRNMFIIDELKKKTFNLFIHNP